MDRLSVSLSRFPQVVAISVFDSCSTYSFCEALALLSQVSWVIFYFQLAYYFAICSSLISTWN